MALPVILKIISAIGMANQDNGQPATVSQAQGYAGMNDQQPQQQPSIGTLQGIQPQQQQPQQSSGGGNAMNNIHTIGNIANSVNSLQNSGQQQGPYQMPYLRRR